VLKHLLVFPAKYRQLVFDTDKDEFLKEVYLQLDILYQVKFIEIGSDKDHVHLLV